MHGRRWGFIRVRARCIAIDGSGRLLVQITPDGHVEIPGGRLEYEESIPFCLVREMIEEAGVVAEPRELVYVVEFRGVRKGRRRHEILFYFRCNIQGEPHQKERGLRFKWLRPEDLSGETFWPPQLLEYLQSDAPHFPFVRYLSIVNDRVEYILSRRVSPAKAREAQHLP